MWIRVTEWPTVTPSQFLEFRGYSISRRTFKRTKKLFFHLLDLAILNSYILNSSCGDNKISHGDFRYTVLRNMLAHAGPEQEYQGH